jgi:alpha-N-arabinofuranosidase
MAAARLSLDPRMTVGPVSRRLFGSFVEHLGRAVMNGIYEPSHPSANEQGFRADVIDLVAELGVSIIRYPGGNFVSAYKWEDGVGPVAERPRRLDLAWHSIETNEVGLHEFAGWVESVGSELMLALNLGTRGIDAALSLLEYCNLNGGTALADERARNGRVDPFAIKMWCLGNEMDGPWQIGHRSADDYGKLASQTAKAMRAFDPSLELVVCGSSNAHMPTFGEWERTVLSHTYDDIDYISCHAYYEEQNGDLGSLLASAVDMDHFIESVTATADHVKAVRGSDKIINLSFDEWNVWYQSRFENVDKITGVDNWPIAPRLLEDSYSVADAVVVGNLLISLLRHADRVTSACLAQLVNIIAPIMTEPGGIAWRQTIFFPFALTSQLARGESLQPQLSCDDYDTASYGSVPVVDAAATYDPQSGHTSIFVVNRGQTETTELTVELLGLTGDAVGSATTLSDDDVYAANTLADPVRVAPHTNESLTISDGYATIVLPPVSWTGITLSPLPWLERPER